MIGYHFCWSAFPARLWCSGSSMVEERNQSLRLHWSNKWRLKTFSLFFTFSSIYSSFYWLRWAYNLFFHRLFIILSEELPAATAAAAVVTLVAESPLSVLNSFFLLDHIALEIYLAPFFLTASFSYFINKGDQKRRRKEREREKERVQ